MADTLKSLISCARAMSPECPILERLGEDDGTLVPVDTAKTGGAAAYAQALTRYRM